MKCDERDKVMNYCPKFTVIIPVYNVAAYLAKCIDSVLKQEFKQYEVILKESISIVGSRVCIGLLSQLMSLKRNKLK